MKTSVTTELKKSSVLSLSKPQALIISISITLITMLIEFIASMLTGSLMLFSDALHMLSHASSLGVTYVAMILANRSVGKNFPFGFNRVEILAALFNGFSLIVFSGYVIYEAIVRMINPQDVQSPDMIIVAIVGLLVNLLTAFILSRTDLEDLNTKSAFLHLLADTFSSVAIIIGGIVIYYTNWYVIDALLSIVVAAVILKWAIGLIRESSNVLMERTPNHINLEEIEGTLINKFELINKVNQLKVWEINDGKYFAVLTIVCKETSSKNLHVLASRIKQFMIDCHLLTDVNIEIGLELE